MPLFTPKPHRRRTKLLVLAVTLVLAGIVIIILVLRQEPLAASPQELQTQVLAQTPVDTAEPNTIIYTADGFMPKHLTVVRGSSVTFVNTTSQPIQPQADGRSCGFDTEAEDCSTIEPLQRRRITYVNAGDIVYRNALRPGVVGTITIE